MKEEEKWKTITITGLSRYEVSECSKVRIASTKQLLPIKNGIVGLIRYGTKNLFDAESLKKITFESEMKEENPHQRYIKEENVFSENEDDYGIGVHSIHWQELKNEITKVKFLKKNEEKDSNLGS